MKQLRAYGQDHHRRARRGRYLPWRSYFKPATTDATVQNGNVYRTDGFVMPFYVHIVPVRKNREFVRRLLARTRELYDQSTCPAGRGLL